MHAFILILFNFVKFHRLHLHIAQVQPRSLGTRLHVDILVTNRKMYQYYAMSIV